MSRAAAIYIHVPFCLRKCPYCDFYSVVWKNGWVERYLSALLAELDLRLDSVDGPISSVYFGGGTPSLLSPDAIGRILTRLRQLLPFASEVEVTLECNPSANARADFFRALLQAGVNRLSIGVQSFQDLNLKKLGRIHDASEALRAVREARRAGFENVSVDLIYGIPNQRMSEWLRDLQLAVSEGATHISAYELTVEPGTALSKWVEKGLVRLPGPDRVAEFYLRAHELLTESGFEHYEVSNYSLPGFRCRHNEGYWRRTPYLGLGPSAHSFFRNCRSWNWRDLRKYCSLLESGRLPLESKEELSSSQELAERVFLGLRTRDGVEIDSLAPGPELPARLRAVAEEYREHLELDDGRVRPTALGMLVAEELALRLIRSALEENGARPEPSGFSA